MYKIFYYLTIISFIVAGYCILAILVRLIFRKGPPIKKFGMPLAISLVIIGLSFVEFYDDYQRKKRYIETAERINKVNEILADEQNAQETQKVQETELEPVVNLRDKVEEILKGPESNTKTKLNEDDVIATYHNALNSVFGSYTKNQVSVDEDLAKQFLANTSLYPAQDKESIEAVKKQSISDVDYAKLMKKPGPYQGKTLDYKGYAADFQRQEDQGIPFNFILVVDKDYDYIVIIFKEIGNIKKEDEIRFWGSPIGLDSFKNVSGETRKAVVFFGSHIEKIK